MQNSVNRNSQTGPKTAAGKARSSQNALKHGLTAKAILLPGEDPAVWQEHLDSYLARFQPIDLPERDLVHRMAAAQWRIERSWRIETEILTRRMHYEQLHSKEPLSDGSAAALSFRQLSDEYRALENLNRQESRLSREYERALRELELLRRTRPPVPPPAVHDRNPVKNEIPPPHDATPESSSPPPVILIPVRQDEDEPLR